MSGSVSYAAAVTTPNGAVRQPQIQAQACSEQDLRVSFEAQATSQRPGAGMRPKTSFRGWSKKPEKNERGSPRHQPGPVREVHHSRHVPRGEHTPNTEQGEELVYILTLKLTESLARPMTEMRERFFPKKLNRIPAHLTLFHALPHSQLEALESGLSRASSSMQPFAVSSGKPFRMRKGVGVNVDAGFKNMKELHEQLRSQWLPFLSEQDAGGFRPHWTVMNKVDDEGQVEGAFDAIRSELSDGNQEGEALGLDLWKYDRGRWNWAKEYRFGDAMQRQEPPGAQGLGGSSKRPGMWKRGSSVGDALRTLSFRGKS